MNNIHISGVPSVKTEDLTSFNNSCKAVVERIRTGELKSYSHKSIRNDTQKLTRAVNLSTNKSNKTTSSIKENRNIPVAFTLFPKQESHFYKVAKVSAVLSSVLTIGVMVGISYSLFALGLMSPLSFIIALGVLTFVSLSLISVVVIEKNVEINPNLIKAEENFLQERKKFLESADSRYDSLTKLEFKSETREEINKLGS